MNYSCINYVIYTLKLKKEEFVIGGKFAGCLCEPDFAAAFGNDNFPVEIYVSSESFDKLRRHGEGKFRRGTGGFQVGWTDHVEFAPGAHTKLVVYRTMPEHWVNRSGYQVVNPRVLKQTFWNRNNYVLSEMIREDSHYEAREATIDYTPEEEAFKAECEKMDWYYTYSDDNSVWRRGQAERKRLEARRDELGGNAPAIFRAVSTR